MKRIRGLRRSHAASAATAGLTLRLRLRPLCALIIAAALAGCAVGPNFRAPDAPAVPAYTADKLPEATTATDAPTGDAQKFLEGQPVPERWWTTFASEEIDRRVEQALAHSPTIASAQAALKQAQENVSAANGGLFPSVDANVGAQRGNANSFGQLAPGQSVFNVYTAGVNINYTLDLFGGIRRGIEAQAAIADFQQYQLEGTYLTLAANVVATSFLEASLRGQIEAIERALTEEAECERIMHMIAGIRGGVAGLMAEVVEDHIRTHLVDPERNPGALNADAADQLIEVVHTYLK